jgi:hypothetical protein
MARYNAAGLGTHLIHLLLVEKLNDALESPFLHD